MSEYIDVLIAFAVLAAIVTTSTCLGTLIGLGLFVRALLTKDDDES